MKPTCKYCEDCEERGLEPIYHDHMYFLKSKKIYVRVEDVRRKE